MPSSFSNQINQILQLIVLTKPRSILDIGVGFGKYGFLSREYLELWDDMKEYRKWKTRIDGIEAFKEYLTPVHDYIYDNMYIGNAKDIVPKLDVVYDLILLIDIFEHFDFKEGMEFLRVCKKQGRNIIISTPMDIYPQQDVFGNPFEVHKCQWQKKHFKDFTNKFFYYHQSNLICYIADDCLDIRRIKKEVQLASLKEVFKTHIPFMKTIYKATEQLWKKIKA